MPKQRFIGFMFSLKYCCHSNWTKCHRENCITMGRMTLRFLYLTSRLLFNKRCKNQHTHTHKIRMERLFESNSFSATVSNIETIKMRHKFHWVLFLLFSSFFFFLLLTWKKSVFILVHSYFGCGKFSPFNFLFSVQCQQMFKQNVLIVFRWCGMLTEFGAYKNLTTELIRNVLPSFVGAIFVAFFLKLSQLFFV